jgi:hypothetical protein
MAYEPGILTTPLATGLGYGGYGGWGNYGLSSGGYGICHNNK